jgi:hypothetical protein
MDVEEQILKNEKTANTVVKLDFNLEPQSMIGLEKAQYDILVFADSFSDSICQKRYLLIEQLAKYHRILFVEQPYINSHVGVDQIRLVKRKDNLVVIKPLLKTSSTLGKLLKQYIENEEIAFGWFYSVSCYHLTDKFKFQKIVYDCDQDFFLPQMEKKKELLINNSHYIFTASKTLFEEKSITLKNLHWIPYPSENFLSRKGQSFFQQPEYILNPERPIIGYCGVVDEKIDFTFIREIAKDLPKATLVFIGPVLETVTENLPESDNIIFLSLSHHSQITSYLKAFDIAILPYVSDDEIGVNTSKIQNYMVANKPIISTPLNDLIRDYGHCINFVKNSNEFCTVASKLLSADPSDADERWTCYSKILNRNSWEEVAFRVKELLKIK